MQKGVQRCQAGTMAAAATMRDRRVDLYVSLARGGCNTELALEAHGVASVAQLTPFLAQDLQAEDNKLRSTALFMCATCHHELYREFDLKILTECCAEAIRGPNNEPGSRHASSTLAVRALAKTLSCAYHFPPEGEDEDGVEKYLRLIVGCAFEASRHEGNEAAAAMSVCALKGLESLARMVTEHPACGPGGGDAVGKVADKSGSSSPSHFFWNARRKRASFERDLRTVLAEGVTGARGTDQFGDLLACLGEHARPAALSCARRCLEICPPADGLQAHLWADLVRSRALLRSPTLATRQEACLLALTVAGSGNGGMAKLAKPAISAAVGLLDESAGRVSGIACPDLIRSCLRSLRLLPPGETASAAKITAKVGNYLRRATSRALAAGRPLSGEESDFVALWASETVLALYRELRREGDWPAGVTASAALGLAEDGGGGGAFDHIAFAMAAQCVCSGLKEETLRAEVSDPVGMAYAQEPKHAPALAWLELAVKALGEFGSHKEGRVSVAEGGLALQPTRALAFAAYSDLLHASLCVSACLRGKGSPESFEKAQFLGQMLQVLVHDILDNFKAGTASQARQVVYLDALQSYARHCDVVAENRPLLSVGPVPSQGSQEEVMAVRQSQAEAAQMSFVGKAALVAREVLLARCIDADQGEWYDRQAPKLRDFYLGSIPKLCALAESYVSRCLTRMHEFARQPDRGALMFLPMLSVLQEFAQSDRMDAAAKAVLVPCVERILENINAGQGGPPLADESRIGAALEESPPTLLALPEGEGPDYGGLLASARLSCARALSLGASCPLPFDDTTALRTGAANEERLGRLEEVFPAKKILSSRGDLVQVTASCSTLHAGPPGHRGARLWVRFQVLSRANLSKVWITLGSTGACTLDRRAVAIISMSEGDERSFDILVDVTEVGRCALVPHLRLVGGGTEDRAGEGGIRFYSDGPPRGSAAMDSSAAASGGRTIEYTFSPLRLGVEHLLIAPPRRCLPAGNFVGEFLQLWSLFRHETRVELPEALSPDEVHRAAGVLHKRLRMACVTDPLEVRSKVNSGEATVEARFLAETFDRQAILCALCCDKSGESGRYSAVLRFRTADRSIALAPLAALVSDLT